MMHDSDLRPRPAPTPQRPLLGQTLLLIEDSRYASEAVRLLALRSGARIRRADCLASAERHLLTYRAGVAIIDDGLPDGSGLDLIRRIARSRERPTVVLATSGQDRVEIEEAALAAGADGFLPKPIQSLAAFQAAILRHMPPELQPKGLRVVGSETIQPDDFALTEDLAYADRLLAEDGAHTGFVASFLTSLARAGQDRSLLSETEGLAAHAMEDLRPRLRELIAARMGEQRKI